MLCLCFFLFCRVSFHFSQFPIKTGFFCASPGEGFASGQCSAGYFCLSGARSPTPEDGGATGDRCPEGHYCPRGSSAPLPCPVGHYSNKTRSSQLSDCLPCPAGWNWFTCCVHCHLILCIFIWKRINITACNRIYWMIIPFRSLLCLLNAFFFLFQVFCVSPEGSLSLLISVRLALTVQAE